MQHYLSILSLLCCILCIHGYTFCIYGDDFAVCHTPTEIVNGRDVIEIRLPASRLCLSLNLIDGDNIEVGYVELTGVELESDVPCRYDYALQVQTGVCSSWVDSTVAGVDGKWGWAVHDEDYDGYFNCAGSTREGMGCADTSACDVGVADVMSYCEMMALHGDEYWDEYEYFSLMYSQSCAENDYARMISGVWCSESISPDGTNYETGQISNVVSPDDPDHIILYVSGNSSDDSEYLIILDSNSAKSVELEGTFGAAYYVTPTTFDITFSDDDSGSSFPPLLPSEGYRSTKSKRGVCELIYDTELFVGEWDVKQISQEGVNVIASNYTIQFTKALDKNHQFFDASLENEFYQVIDQGKIVLYAPGINYFGIYNFSSDQNTFTISLSTTGRVSLASSPGQNFILLTGTRLNNTITTTETELIEAIESQSTESQSIESQSIESQSIESLSTESTYVVIDLPTIVDQNICDMNLDYCGPDITIDEELQLGNITVDGVTLTIGSSPISFQNLDIINSKLVLNKSPTINIDGCLTTENATLVLILEDDHSQDLVLIKYKCYEKFANYSIENANPNCDNELQYQDTQLVLVFKNCTDDFPVWVFILVAGIVLLVAILLILILTVPGIRKTIFPYRDRKKIKPTENDRMTTVMEKLDILDRETTQLTDSVNHVNEMIEYMEA